MRLYHPDDFKPGQRYLLKGRPGKVYIFHDTVTLTYPDGRHGLELIFEPVVKDPNNPDDKLFRHIPATSPLEAEEV